MRSVRVPGASSFFDLLGKWWRGELADWSRFHFCNRGFGSLGRPLASSVFTPLARQCSAPQGVPCPSGDCGPTEGRSSHAVAAKRRFWEPMCTCPRLGDRRPCRQNVATYGPSRGPRMLPGNRLGGMHVGVKIIKVSPACREAACRATVVLVPTRRLTTSTSDAQMSGVAIEPTVVVCNASLGNRLALSCAERHVGESNLSGTPKIGCGRI